MNMIISDTDFFLNYVLHIRKGNGRYYILMKPTGKQSRAARKGLMVYKRISQAYYELKLGILKARLLVD